MNNLQNHIENYLDYCRTQKCLDKKTLKAYRIDLRQFSEQISVTEASDLTSATLETYFFLCLTSLIPLSFFNVSLSY